MQSVSISKARSTLYGIVDTVDQNHAPLLIVGKRANAVIISEEDWKAIQETLFLDAIPGMRDSILEGLKTPIDKCSKDLPW